MVPRRGRPHGNWLNKRQMFRGTRTFLVCRDISDYGPEEDTFKQIAFPRSPPAPSRWLSERSTAGDDKAGCDALPTTRIQLR